MPRGQPFTRLCRQLAQLRAESQRADLHLHTTHSDGDWPPEEVVRRAAERGLGAIAITDHDTCSALPVARAFVQTLDTAPEIINGVEITCEFRGRELHLLGYFFYPDEPALRSALERLREQRRQRFLEMVERLPAAGLNVDPQTVRERLASGRALGRRDLAGMLVRAGHVQTIAEAFARILNDGGPIALPNRGLPVGEAIELVHGAGGVTSWAHPPEDADADQVNKLRELGLDALEALYPTYTSARSRGLRELARAASFAITGGSDCHGPSPVSRMIGNWGIRRPELEELRARTTSNAAIDAV